VRTLFQTDELAAERYRRRSAPDTRRDVAEAADMLSANLFQVMEAGPGLSSALRSAFFEDDFEDSLNESPSQMSFYLQIPPP
jgi:hypothetical protein